MILERKVDESGDIWLVTPDGRLSLRTHERVADCGEHGCVIHNPSQHALSGAPLNWREDRGIMERICEHGVGHPDVDSAAFLNRAGRGVQNVHGCCGCCA